MSFLSKLNILKLIIFQHILIRIVLSEQYIDSYINNIFSFINEKVIDIINNQTNNYSHNFIISDCVKDILLKSNQTIIIHNQNIIKINETYFLYFGIKDNNFCIKIYEIEGEEIIISKYEQCHNIPNDLCLNDIKYLEGKLISEKKILLTAIIHNNYEIIIFDLKNNELTINVIPEIISMKTMIKNKIQCESINGDNFFCILSYLNNNDLNLFYIGIKLDNIKDINYGIICT